MPESRDSRRLYNQGWNKAERLIIREYAAMSGHKAYIGHPATNAAIRKEAARCLNASKLLAPHVENKDVCSLFISSFLRAWREAELEQSG